MKILYIIILIIILGGIGYVLWGNNSEDAPAAEAPDTSIDGEIQGQATFGDGADESSEMAEADHVFDVAGTNFAFDITEMRVQEGDVVTVNLVSEEGYHDWVVDEFDAATEKIREGETTSVTFVADASGTYEYYCSVGSHREQGMVGTLIVE